MGQAKLRYAGVVVRCAGVKCSTSDRESRRFPECTSHGVVTDTWATPLGGFEPTHLCIPVWASPWVTAVTNAYLRPVGRTRA